MKLVKARITNFRSVEDSGDVDIDGLLALVGKNEAGKTAILQALAGFNPHPSTSMTYDVERDYPRRFLTEYKDRHGDKEAEVVRTYWELLKEERQELEAMFGEGSIGDAHIVGARRYKATTPEWTLPTIDFKKAVFCLASTLGLSAAELEPLDSAETSDKARGILEKLESRTSGQTKLLEKLTAFPGKNITGAITAKLASFLPQFMYFSY